MSEKLSDEKRAELVKHLTNMGWGLDQRGGVECTDEGSAMAAQEIEALAAANATLERALAEMTRQRDEALKEPTYEEERAAVEDTQRSGICESFIAARRKRITGEGA